MEKVVWVSVVEFCQGGDRGEKVVFALKSMYLLAMHLYLARFYLLVLCAAVDARWMSGFSPEPVIVYKNVPWSLSLFPLFPFPRPSHDCYFFDCYRYTMLLPRRPPLSLSVERLIFCCCCCCCCIFDLFGDVAKDFEVPFSRYCGRSEVTLFLFSSLLLFVFTGWEDVIFFSNLDEQLPTFVLLQFDSQAMS